MSTFSVKYWIVLRDDSLIRWPRAGESVEYTMPGACLYSVGGIVPVIIAGDRCAGLAKVERLTISETSTTVMFTIVQDGSGLGALYDAYCLQSDDGTGDIAGYSQARRKKKETNYTSKDILNIMKGR